MIKQILLLLLAFTLITSCQDDEFLYEQEQTKEMTSSKSTQRNVDDFRNQTKIILGKKLKNPYSVENMQIAFNYYNKIVLNSKFKNKQIKATHQYIKFLPTSHKHLKTLDELDNSDDRNSITLQDYPMDYEIIQEGDYYVDPKSETDLYYPAYTTIPVGYQIPHNIPYEVIDNLYKPTEEEFAIETIALVFADDQEDLVAQFGVELTRDDLPKLLIEFSNPKYNNINFQAKGWFSSWFGGWFSKRYRPHGWVKVQNTETNNLDPLKQAKISIGRWFWWKYTYTDDGGHFTSPKKYRGKVRIRAKWRGYTATIRKHWNELLGFWVSDHLMTIYRSTNGRTKNIYQWSEHLWYKGTVHNGLRKYNDYADLKGLDLSISYANIWVWRKGDGSASTPMLYRYPQLNTLAMFAGIGQANLWNVLTNIGSGIVIGIVPPWLRPDQIYSGLKDKETRNGVTNTAIIEQTVLHESTHYSHARKAGSWFWAKIFSSEISNSIQSKLPGNGMPIHGDPYQDGSRPSYQAGRRIALAEGWATFIEFKAMNHYYGKAWGDVFNSSSSTISNDWVTDTSTYIENFDVYDTPINQTRFDDKSWFLHGLFYDILDDNNENNQSFRLNANGVFINDIHDKLNLNNDISLLYNLLTYNTHDACDLRTKLLQAYPNKIEYINLLFYSYGYCGEITPN